MEKLSDKVSYIRGLCEGLALDDSTKEGKVLLAMMDLLDGIVDTVCDMDDDLDQVFDELDQVYEEIDAVDADLDAIEEELWGDDEDDCGHHHCHCGCGDDDDDDDDDDMYEFTCPNCGDSVIVDEETLCDDSFACPSCGLKFADILDGMEDDEDDKDED